MGRSPTQNYQADTDTLFQWADSDNDQFDRDFDLYCLARALEKHDHGPGRGLAVARLGGSAIGVGSYAPGSIPHDAYMDGSIYGAKIPNGGITFSKLEAVPVKQYGDVMSGDYRIARPSLPTPGLGLLFFGDRNDTYLMYNQGHWRFSNRIAGGTTVIDGDLHVQRIGVETTGYTFYAGHYVGWDGSKFVADGVKLMTSPPAYMDVPGTVPYMGCLFIYDMAWMPGDGTWTRETNANGRIIVGSGTTAGTPNTFVAGTAYGTQGWTLTNNLTASHNLTAPAGGGGGSTTHDTNASSSSGTQFYASNVGSTGPGATLTNTAGHVHPFVDYQGGGSGGTVTGTVTINGTNSYIFPPMYSMPMIRRRYPGEP